MVLALFVGHDIPDAITCEHEELVHGSVPFTDEDIRFRDDDLAWHLEVKVAERTRHGKVLLVRRVGIAHDTPFLVHCSASRFDPSRFAFPKGDGCVVFAVRARVPLVSRSQDNLSFLNQDGPRVADVGHRDVAWRDRHNCGGGSAVIDQVTFDERRLVPRGLPLYNLAELELGELCHCRIQPKTGVAQSDRKRTAITFGCPGRNLLCGLEHLTDMLRAIIGGSGPAMAIEHGEERNVVAPP
mmetsp:Transcript_11293/g.28474  ORF Transcript_11293/g.28474 Transcript_11293/m.28474 type:complete len:241 (-) Transcript_11293:247-969(-)